MGRKKGREGESERERVFKHVIQRGREGEI